MNVCAAAATAVPSVLPLTRFYPTVLPSSPGGKVDEPEIWAAKVQGLLAAAPLLLQQSLLNSQTSAEFNANVALLQQMQEGLLKQGGRDVKTSSVGNGRVGATTSRDGCNAAAIERRTPSSLNRTAASAMVTMPPASAVAPAITPAQPRSTWMMSAPCHTA